LVAAVLTSASAIAQTVPPEGWVSVIFTATPIPMPIGGREFVFINQAMAASNEAGNAVLNVGGRCQLSRLTDSSPKTAEIHRLCTYVDTDGDQLFEQCDWMPGYSNNCTITGETGKFEGLPAALVITSTAQEQPRWH
jgi:hypothetical protein